jgi:hypothetical protein
MRRGEMFSKRFLFGFVLFASLLAVPLFISVPGFSQEPEPYTFVLKWGSTGSGNGQFNLAPADLGLPGGIAFDSMDNVYIIDRGNSRIQKFDKNGNYLLQWGTYGTGDNQFMWPAAISIDRNDNVYVSDGPWERCYPNLPRVLKFTSQGVFLMKYERTYTPNPLYLPGGIDFDEAGFIYLVDSHGIKKFNPDFTLIDSFGTCGYDDTDPYQFSHPSYVGVNSKSEIFVSIWGDYPEGLPGQIRKYGSDFSFVNRWYLPWVSGIAIDSEDNVFACSCWLPDMGVYKYDSSGNLLQRVVPNAIDEYEDGKVFGPLSIAFDSKGNLYVSDVFNRIQKFAPPLKKYTFEGFFSPIENLPVVNQAKAGQAIPVKWRITDKNGLPISDPASFINITSYRVDCASFEGDPTNSVEEVAAGNSGLQYLGDGWWQFNWKTSKTYKGQCRVMKLTLDDKSEHTASFSFK